jgi:hypothetical protein
MVDNLKKEVRWTGTADGDVSQYYEGVEIGDDGSTVVVLSDSDLFGSIFNLRLTE